MQLVVGILLTVLLKHI